MSEMTTRFSWIITHRRSLLLTMGMLDAFLLGSVYKRVRSWRVELFDPSLREEALSLGLTLVEMALLISLIATAAGLVLQKSWALKLYYCQFPFRLIFMYLTFGFILVIIPWPAIDPRYNPLVLFVLLMEAVRLGVTIILHRNWQQGNLAFA